MRVVIKNLFALQKGTVATLCIVYALFFTLASCDKQVPILEWEDEEPATSQVKGEEVGEEEVIISHLCMCEEELQTRTWDEEPFFLCDEQGKPYDSFYSLNQAEEEIMIHASIKKDRVVIRTRSFDEAEELSKHPIFLEAGYLNVHVIANIDPERTSLDNLMQIPGVIDVTYAVEDRLGFLYLPTNRIYVNFEHGVLPEDVIDAAGLTKIVESIELMSEFHNGYYLTFSNVRLGNILRLARYLHKLAGVDFAQPTFILISYTLYPESL